MIKLDISSAVHLARILTSEPAAKNSKHLLMKRRDRLEFVANRALSTQEEMEEFIRAFLQGADLRFSFLLLSPRKPIPAQIQRPPFIDQAEAFLREASLLRGKVETKSRFRVPLWLLGKQLAHHRMDERLYLYCLKGPHTLVLAGRINGNLLPQDGLGWSLRFDWNGVTFLNFEETTEYIRTVMAENPCLRRYDELISFFFPIFRGQAIQVNERFVEAELDDAALVACSPLERRLLVIYMSTFHGYGEADPGIVSLCDSIQDLREKRTLGNPQFAVGSPSYQLPLWFVDFWSVLSKEEQEFLESLNSSELNPLAVRKIVELLHSFQSGQVALARE